MSMIERKARQVRNVQVSGCCRVRVVRNATPRLTITTSDASGNEEVATRYEDDTLIVASSAPGTVPMLGNMELAGNSFMRTGRDQSPGNGRLASALHAGDVTPLVDIALHTVTRIRLAGTGEVVLQGLDQSELDIRLTGSGHVVVGGRVGYLRVAINGLGNVDASSMRAWGVSLHLVGSGAIRAHATGAAMACLSGPGNIVIFGHPALRDGRTYGGGAIHYR